MSVAYFDTSALVKLFLVEPGSALARKTWETAAAVATAQITYAESRAALAAAARCSPPRLGADDFARAKRALEMAWARMATINVTGVVVRMAGDLAESHALRGYDAVHLACALHTAADALVCADAALIVAAEARKLDIIDVRS